MKKTMTNRAWAWIVVAIAIVRFLLPVSYILNETIEGNCLMVGIHDVIMVGGYLNDKGADIKVEMDNIIWESELNEYSFTIWMLGCFDKSEMNYEIYLDVDKRSGVDIDLELFGVEIIK